MSRLLHTPGRRTLTSSLVLAGTAALALMTLALTSCSRGTQATAAAHEESPSPPRPPEGTPDAAPVAAADTDGSDAGAATRALPAVTLDARMQQAGGIDIVAARAEPWPDVIEAPGVLHLDERRTARLGSLVEAVVAVVDKQVGDSVTRGETIATLHSHRTHDARADQRKADAEVRRLAADHAYAIELRDRAARLLAAKAIPAQELKRAEADVAARAEALTAARAEATRAGEELEHLGLTSGMHDASHSGDAIGVRAPQSGQVIERLVTPGTAVTAGQPLLVISDLAHLWLIAEVDERFLRHVAVGQPLAFTVSAYGDETFSATVVAIGDTIDPRTRRVSVRCAVPNPQRRLKPEMFALVRLTASERTLVTVPADAIQAMNQTDVVFVETAPGRFEPRPITTGAAHDGRVAIVRGLAAGDRVVGRGAFLLKSRMQQHD